MEKELNNIARELREAVTELKKIRRLLTPAIQMVEDDEEDECNE